MFRKNIVEDNLTTTNYVRCNTPELESDKRFLKQINIAVTPELRKDFKIACAKQGLSMTGVLMGYMLDFVNLQQLENEQEVQ